MSNNRLIGMMDSGFGGVSVLNTAMRMMPNESFYFFGDNGNAPYGGKPMEEIRRLTLDVIQKLMSQDVKSIVIACNTATSAAIDEVRKRAQCPVISMEPAIKPALEKVKGRVLMLATPATCDLSRYIRLRNKLDDSHRITDVPCHGLVEWIEKNLFDRQDCDELIDEILHEFRGMEIDGIVLGCTHFALVQPAIERYAKAHFTGQRLIFDGRKGVVRRLQWILEQNQSLAEKSCQQQIILHSSGDESVFLPAMQRILKMDL